MRATIARCALYGVVAFAANQKGEQGTPGEPYPNMPRIAPIGVRIGKYIDVPESSRGPAVDRAKGYRLQKLGEV